MKKELRILVVEDVADDLSLINYHLRKAGFNFRSRRVESRDAFLHELEHHPPDVILSDHGVPGFDGFAALAEARNRCPDVPFIFVTGTQHDEAADQTVQSGADDYVLKNRLNLLAPAIERAMRDVKTRARHRQLETALHEAEDQLHQLAAEIKEYATFMLDTEGRIATWAAGAEQLLGYEPNEILGREFEILFSADARENGEPKRLLEAALQSRRAESGVVCLRRDGECLDASVIVVGLRSYFKQRGYLCIVRDRSRAHGESRAHESFTQLQAANRELEEFTHAIALDLRAPLRHIESFTELLRKNSDDRLDHKSRSYLKTISESAHQMSRLIDDLFTFARIGQAEMYRLHCSLREIAKEVVHDLRHEAEGRTLEWVIGDLPEVMGDPVMLWLVLTNLLSNALKFTRPREQARIEIGSTSTPSEHVIFVRDNGVGFDMHYADRLFGVFQRLHTKEFEGTGVGLANVRRIIQRHGGRTWAEGGVDEGATFFFTLPRQG